LIHCSPENRYHHYCQTQRQEKKSANRTTFYVLVRQCLNQRHSSISGSQDVCETSLATIVKAHSNIFPFVVVPRAIQSHSHVPKSCMDTVLERCRICWAEALGTDSQTYTHLSTVVAQCITRADIRIVIFWCVVRQHSRPLLFKDCPSNELESSN
jgi:hypothetical protein